MERNAPQDRGRTLTPFESLQRPDEFIKHAGLRPKVERGFGCNVSPLEVKVLGLLEGRDVEFCWLVIMKAGLKCAPGVLRPSVSGFEIVDAAVHLPTERGQAGPLLLWPAESNVSRIDDLRAAIADLERKLRDVVVRPAIRDGDVGLHGA